MEIKKKDRGFALIIVLSLSVVLITILSEIMFQTEIESRASVGERNRLNAESSAITGSQFANMLFVLDANIPSQFKGEVEKMLGGKQIFQLLDDVPIGGGALENLKDLGKLNLNAMLDGALLDGLKAVPGYFVLKTTDESAKLNLNLAIRQDMAGWLLQALKKVFSQTHERRFLEEKGYKPERLAANIVDYIDAGDKDALEPGTDENIQYEQAKFTHKPKNGAMQSLEELRRVPGFNDDEIFNVFSPYFTVWPTNPTSPQSLNINTAATELMAALLAPDNGEVPQESFDKYEDEKIKNPATDIKDISGICQTATGSNKCPDFLSNMAVTESNIFKVEIEGVADNLSRTLTYVFDRGLKGKGSSAGSPSQPGTKPGSISPATPQFKVLYKQFR